MAAALLQKNRSNVASKKRLEPQGSKEGHCAPATE